MSDIDESDDDIELSDDDMEIDAEDDSPSPKAKVVEVDDHSIAARAAIRERLSDDVRRFLESGGSIQTIAPNVTADPPKKPDSSYGSQPI